MKFEIGCLIFVGLTPIMNPFQHVFFDTVEEMLHYVKPEERRLVEKLREIVLTCLPDATEKLAYNVPFYYRYARICFIWPGSVPWGRVKEGVLFGFCKGHLLSDVSDLETSKRKNVFTKTVYTLKEISQERLSQLLYEAAWIDEEENNMKKAKPSRHR